MLKYLHESVPRSQTPFADGRSSQLKKISAVKFQGNQLHLFFGHISNDL